MQLFENEVKCKNCMHNVNNKCIFFGGKDVNKESAGCYNGIDTYNKQKIDKEMKRIIKK